MVGDCSDAAPLGASGAVRSLQARRRVTKARLNAVREDMVLLKGILKLVRGTSARTYPAQHMPELEAGKDALRRQASPHRGPGLVVAARELRRLDGVGPS